MKKLILRNFQSPGDILMLTAAVRDLHRRYPRNFQTDIRTSCPELWLRNPYLTQINEDDPDASIIDCEYPLIHRSNEIKLHFLHGFIEFINEKLGLNIELSELKGDIHLTSAEKKAPSPVAELTGLSMPFWIVVAGGKYDFTIKWWQSIRYQKVVDYFQDRLAFVQVGEAGHFHPPLDGVIDLRGRTSIRRLIQLVQHADGVLCPVTFLMHLAAAVPLRRGRRKRAGIIIAGGREPVHWEAYPQHDFLHTIGKLPCCEAGGCWHSRAVPLHDGEIHDTLLCVDSVEGLPRCMDSITPDQVIYLIEQKIDARDFRVLSERQRSSFRDCARNERNELGLGTRSIQQAYE